jgi:hypothetical protein
MSVLNIPASGLLKSPDEGKAGVYNAGIFFCKPLDCRHEHAGMTTQCGQCASLENRITTFLPVRGPRCGKRLIIPAFQ